MAAAKRPLGGSANARSRTILAKGASGLGLVDFTSDEEPLYCAAQSSCHRQTGGGSLKGISMYAVIRTGGKQYRVEKGDQLRVERLAGNVGDSVSFDQVLLVGGEALKLGRPLVGGANVEAKIVAQDLGPKLVVFKFRRRKNYRRRQGHRQPFTALEITNVVA